MKVRWLVFLAASFVLNDPVAAAPQWMNRILKRGEDNKYFHEPGNDDLLGHYDTRYFGGIVSYDERTETLTHMIRAYLIYFRDNKLETWIAHGTLLGWWWNGKVIVGNFLLSLA